MPAISLYAERVMAKRRQAVRVRTVWVRRGVCGGALCALQRPLLSYTCFDTAAISGRIGVLHSHLKLRCPCDKRYLSQHIAFAEHLVGAKEPRPVHACILRSQSDVLSHKGQRAAVLFKLAAHNNKKVVDILSLVENLHLHNEEVVNINNEEVVNINSNVLHMRKVPTWGTALQCVLV